MMDELPAIIHRLSLQLWCPDQVPKEEEDLKEDSGEATVNPLATPPLDAVDANGHLLDPAEISTLSLDGGAEVQSLFSQKNLLRLASLSDAHRTLALLTPNVQDVLVRAWATPSDRLDAASTPPLSTPSLIKSQSFQGTATSYTFSDTSSQDHGHLPSRPSLVSLHSATTGLSLGSGRHSKAGRKKKNRLVDLRRKTGSEVSSEAGDSTTETESASVQGPTSEPIISSIPEEKEEGVAVPPNSTPSKVRFVAPLDMSQPPPRLALNSGRGNTANAAVPSAELRDFESQHSKRSEKAPAYQRQTSEKTAPIPIDTKEPMSADEWSRPGPRSDTSSVILEQAWIMKMAGEIARRVYDEKNRNPSFWEGRDDSPPPAYEANIDA